LEIHIQIFRNTYPNFLKYISHRVIYRAILFWKYIVQKQTSNKMVHIRIPPFWIYISQSFRSILLEKKYIMQIKTSIKMCNFFRNVGGGKNCSHIKVKIFLIQKESLMLYGVQVIFLINILVVNSKRNFCIQQYISFI